MHWLLVVGLLLKLVSIAGNVLIGWWLEFFSSGGAPFVLLQSLHNAGQLANILLALSALYWLPKIIKRLFGEDA